MNNNGPPTSAMRPPSSVSMGPLVTPGGPARPPNGPLSTSGPPNSMMRPPGSFGGPIRPPTNGVNGQHQPPHSTQGPLKPPAFASSRPNINGPPVSQVGPAGPGPINGPRPMPNGPNSVGAMRPALGTGPQVQQAGPRAPVMTTRPVPPGGGGGPPGTVGHAVGGGMPQRPLVNGSTQALNPSGTPATQRPSSGVCARPLGPGPMAPLGGPSMGPQGPAAHLRGPSMGPPRPGMSQPMGPSSSGPMVNPPSSSGPPRPGIGQQPGAQPMGPPPSGPVVNPPSSSGPFPTRPAPPGLSTGPPPSSMAQSQSLNSFPPSSTMGPGGPMPPSMSGATLPPPPMGGAMPPNPAQLGPPPSSIGAPPAMNGPPLTSSTSAPSLSRNGPLNARPNAYPQPHPQQPPNNSIRPPMPPANSNPAGMPPPSNGRHPHHNGYGGQQPASGAGNASYPGQDQLKYSFTGVEPVDLLQNRHILPPGQIPTPKPRLQAELWNSLNCSPDTFRSTLTKIPETETVLKKSRLPLGILIHPFKDLSHLPVIQCNTIVRCRQCRTYINPFVHFVDQRRWRCNICYRVNDLPEEFLYDPVSKSYGDPSRRPECKSATIEFIAPSEYMLRPPQPAVYIFCLDVSRSAIETGYLKVFCDTLLEELDKLPGDKRTMVGFLTYDRSVHFYSMPEGASQPTQLNVSDIEDMFLPSPSDLLVNLSDCKPLVQQLLAELPSMFKESFSTDSALGAALQAAYKMASPTGGRITVMQASLPNAGPGSVPAREIQAGSGGQDKNAGLLGPATDFYKKLALECSGQQIAVDLFTMSSQFLDLATLSGISKFSGGQVQHFAGYHVVQNTVQAAKFESALRRYLIRKIGFEAVMRIRCTRGLTPHAFHGNFFVRSTDLLSLPNINPDAGFAMQVAIEDDLRDSREVSFQAALLYTSSKGERRIRVHTFCLPTTASVSDVINGADQQAIVGMLAKFAAERAVNDSMADAKEGLVVSCVDAFETYKTFSSVGHPTGLLISQSLKLMPLYVLAAMRINGFRPNQRLDDRTFCFSQLKTLPLTYLLQYLYPDLYRIDDLTDANSIEATDKDASDTESEEEGSPGRPVLIPQPSRSQLSYERISTVGMYLLDMGDMMYVYICRGIHQFILERTLGVFRLQDVDETMTEFPELDNPESDRVRTFIQWLNSNKPYPVAIRFIREDGKSRQLFTDRMIEDRMDNSFSYFEFLQHLKQQIK